MGGTTFLESRRVGLGHRSLQLAAMVGVGLLLTSCGDDDGGSGTTPPARVVERECDRFDYPCDWRDADAGVLEASLSLLNEAAAMIEEGQSPEAVASDLDARADVVATNWAPEGVVVRLAGGMPVTAMTELASPSAAPGEVTSIGGDSDESAGLIDALATQSSGHTNPRLVTYQASEASTYEPTRTSDIRPRQVMVLSPTREADFEASKAANEEAGYPIPTAPPTATRDAFTDSEHFEVTDLEDEDADASQWARMASFDVVVIETHGAFYDCTEDRELCGLFLAGPLAAPYLADLELTEDEAEFKDFGGYTFAKLGVDQEFHITFSDDFIENLPGSGIGKSIVVLNACRMGEEAVSTTALASVVAGTRGAVFSWDTALPRVSADETTKIVAEYLADGTDVDAAIDELRIRDLDTAQYRGVTSSLRVYHELDLNPRARDIVATHIDGSVAGPGVSINARGTPEDRQHDRIESGEVRIDAVNRGDEDTTRVTITVDGQPVKVIQDGAEVEDVVLDTNTVRADADSTGPWRHHRIDLEDAVLPFDLTDADVTLGVGHIWEVTVQGETGEPAVHRVDPVFFRLGTVRIINPNTPFELTADEEVFIDGVAQDGDVETYDMIIRVEHLAESSDVDEYEVRLSFPGYDEALPLARGRHLPVPNGARHRRSPGADDVDRPRGRVGPETDRRQ